MAKRLLLLLDAIKFEHSVFALPFAYIGMVLAARGFPAWDKVIWITLAMVGARTLAMAANRVLDARYDAMNPRTAGRAIPKGILSRTEMAALGVAGLAAMFFSAWQLNPLCLRLAPLAVVVLVGYSWTKRFTWTSHAVLGLADGLAPAGGWIAVSGTVEIPTLLLTLAVAFWIGGFDLIYACQDVDFDRGIRLHSVPARFGVAAALQASSVSHVIALVLLVLVGVNVGLGLLYWVGLLLSGVLIVHQHRSVSPDDLSNIGPASLNVNGYVAIIVFVFTVGGLYV